MFCHLSPKGFIRLAEGFNPAPTIPQRAKIILAKSSLIYEYLALRAK